MNVDNMATPWLSITHPPPYTHHHHQASSRGSPLSNGSIRLATLLALACAVYSGQQLALDSMGMVTGDVDPLQQLLAATLGFFMYKVAVIGVTVVPAAGMRETVTEQQQQ